MRILHTKIAYKYNIIYFYGAGELALLGETEEECKRTSSAREQSPFVKVHCRTNH